MIVIDSSKSLMLSHARACYPYEACGLIIAKGKKQDVICGRNMAKDRRHAFSLHPGDYTAAANAGEILALYHSHCEEPPVASAPDMTLAEHHNIPVITISLTRDDSGSGNGSQPHYIDSWGIYKPQGWKADLVGRPFVLGVLDCLTLLQDYMMQKHGITIGDYPREPDWWNHQRDEFDGHIVKPATDLYANLPAEGFYPIQRHELREHDMILMQIHGDVPNHNAIYVGDGMMLHHPEGHLSGYHPYVCDRGYYAACTVGFWRHRLVK